MDISGSHEITGHDSGTDEDWRYLPQNMAPVKYGGVLKMGEVLQPNIIHCLIGIEHIPGQITTIH